LTTKTTKKSPEAPPRRAALPSTPLTLKDPALKLKSPFRKY
jgi:hypothetical protein